ncbi:MAG TPA: DUF4365 domain-containing protein [Blastocatellia bacterium]|nr:DUF4365 domain-containing protein [Blastocatellia bacterium]
MADRSISQKIGSQGHRWVMAHIEENPNWLVRGLDEDFGVDAEAELTEDGIVGQILKLQFKSSEIVNRNNNQIEFRIDRKYIEYAKSCRYPVIFIRIDVSEKQAWYLWLQQWILEKRAARDRLEDQESYTIWIDESQTLTSGLNAVLKDIARWRGETQLVLSLLDTMRAAAATYNEDIMSQVVTLLSTTAHTVADASLDIIIQEATILGNSLRGTREGLAISQQLFSLIRTFGDRVSLSSIDAVVRRGDSYSRIGLDALGILYDEYFQHISSLNLSDHFEEKGLLRVAYYCALREANPEKKYIDFMGGPGDFTFAGLKFSCPPEARFWDKYANRGASAILDYLEPEKAS